MSEAGWAHGTITAEGLSRLEQEALAAGRLDKLELPGLEADGFAEGKLPTVLAAAEQGFQTTESEMAEKLARADARFMDTLMQESQLDFWQMAERLAGSGQIGPLASRLVKDSVNRVGSAAELADALSRFVDGGPARDAVRAEALRLGESSPGIGSPPLPSERVCPGPDPATLAPIVAELTAFVGPVADTLVRRLAARATDLESLCSGLAEHIPTESERRAFLSKVRLVIFSGSTTASAQS